MECSHGRNLNKGKNTPLPVCPLCLQGTDDLEHFLCCEHHLISRARNIFHHQLLGDVSAYCRKRNMSQDALSLASEYAKACVSPLLDVNDRIGGWLAIPTPRFLYFFSPDRRVSDTLMSELLNVLPRIIAEHIQWLAKVWRYRCKLVHMPASQSSSDCSSLDSDMLATAGRLSSFTRMTRGQDTHQGPVRIVDEESTTSQLTTDSVPRDGEFI